MYRGRFGGTRLYNGGFALDYFRISNVKSVTVVTNETAPPTKNIIRNDFVERVAILLNSIDFIAANNSSLFFKLLE